MRSSQVLDAASFAAVLRALGTEVYAAQEQIDRASIRRAKSLGGSVTVPNERDKRVLFAGEPVSLLELGMTPTFTQIAEAAVDLKLAITLGEQGSDDEQELTLDAALSAGLKGQGPGVALSLAAVDARYGSRFDFEARSASSLGTRIVPVPPPRELLEKLHGHLDAGQDPGAP